MLRQTKKQRYSHHTVQRIATFALLGFLYLLQPVAHAGQWKQLAPGIEYRDLSPNPLVPWSHVHVFRIDLNEQTLDLVTARELGRPHASVEEMGEHSHALIAINGGFFDTSYHPLGLRIGHHERYSRLKHISWWGVLYTKNNKAYLEKASQFSKSSSINFAIQSGPRLLVNGSSPKLKPGIAERTAIGITRNHHIILLVTEHAPMSTATLADIMKSFPLYCQDALNLDGGSSSQVYANIGSFQLNSHNALGVSDAVIIKSRQ